MQNETNTAQSQQGELSEALNPFSQAQGPVANRDKVQTAGSIAARGTLAILEGVAHRQLADISYMGVEVLLASGLLTSVSKQEYAFLKASERAGDNARSARAELAPSFNTAKEKFETLNAQHSSWIYRTAQFLRLTEKTGKEHAIELATAEAKANRLYEQTADLNKLVNAGELAAKTLAELTPIRDVAVGLSPQGKELLSQLAACRQVLGSYTIEDFKGLIAAIDEQLKSRIERSKELVALFTKAGFNASKDGVVEGILGLSSAPGTQLELLQSASALDKKLLEFKINEKQRLYLVSLMLGSDQPTEKVLQKFSTLIEQVRSLERHPAPTYADLYVAATFAQVAGETADNIKQYSASKELVKQFGFKKNSGIAIHLACRLATEDATGLKEFETFRNALTNAKTGGENEVALAALSLRRLRVSPERAIEQLKATRDALSAADLETSLKTDLALIAAITAAPGIVGPKVRMIQQAYRLLEKEAALGTATIPKAMTICSGVLSDFAGATLIDSQAARAKTLLNTCGVEPKSLVSSHESSSISDGINDLVASFFDNFPLYGDDCGAAHLHDLGHAGHSAAICGSSHHSSHSSCGHGHGGDGGHSDGHASCGHASCGHASCGHAGCGHAGCGGGH